jgi:hypothetical protein
MSQIGDNHEQDSLSLKERALQYQLDFLKLEYGAIHDAIRRIDETTQGTKNWSVIVWAGSLGVALGSKELRGYVALTAVVPLLFWYVDAQWRRIQRSFIFRSRKIGDFLSGPGLADSMKERRIVGLVLLDPRATKESNTEEYRKFTAIRRTLRFKEVGPFYGGLVAISIIVAVVLHWR